MLRVAEFTMRHFKQVIRIAILPTLYLCLCACTHIFVGDDNWSWIVVMTLDIPLLLLMDLFTKSPTYSTTTIVVAGTIWWLCIGIALTCIFEWLKRRREFGADNTDN
jgi:hypothetical protein